MPFIELLFMNMILLLNIIMNMLLLFIPQILSYLPLALVPPPIIEGQLQLGYPTGCSVFQSVGRSFEMRLRFLLSRFSMSPLCGGNW